MISLIFIAMLNSLKYLMPAMILITLFSCNGTRPANIGLTNGKLAPCPATPNCVSTLADKTDAQHYIAPIVYTGSQDSAMANLIRVITDYPRTTIVTQNENYIHAEFKTRSYIFTDDVEFYFPTDKKIIHFRSASRVGKSDLGVNRKRMEEIVKLFDEL